MKINFILSLILCTSLACFAQGYKDGIEYYNVGQYDNAKELLLRNLDDPSTDKSEAYYYLGCIELVAGNDAEAVKYFDQGVAANPEYAYNYVGLGQLELKKGNKKEAEKLFDDAKDLCHKKDPKIIVAIGRAYYAVDEVKYKKEIEKSIKDATKRDKEGADVCVFQGDMLADKKSWGDAAGWYDLAMRYDKDMVEAYVKYANTYFYVSPQVAIQTLEKLSASNPSSALVQRELAEKYYEDDQWTKAAEQYGIYMQNPNHFKQDENRYAGLLFYGKKYQESYDLAEKIISELPAGDKNAFYMKRLELYNLVAMECWNEADALAREFFAMPLPEGTKYEAKDYTDYATALKELGKATEAISLYVKAYELNTSKYDLLKDISSACTDAEDYVGAAKYYQMYVDSADYSTNDLFVLSRRYSNVAATTPDSTAQDSIAKMEAVNKALEYAKIVDEKVPNDTRILSQIARIYVISEKDPRTGKALETYNQIQAILDQDPNNKTEEKDLYIEIFRYKAIYYYLNKDDVNMKQAYLNWLDVDPTNEGLRKYIETLDKKK